MKWWRKWVVTLLLLAGVDVAVAGLEEEIRLVEEGTTTNSATGASLPIHAVIIGKAEERERVAFAFRQLGPYSLDAVIWVPLGADRWKRTEYRRPASAEEWAAFREAPASFRSEVLGRTERLPAPFNALGPAEIGKVDYLIAFREGGLKAVLKPVVKEEAEEFLQAVLALAGRSQR